MTRRGSGGFGQDRAQAAAVIGMDQAHAELVPDALVRDALGFRVEGARHLGEIGRLERHLWWHRQVQKLRAGTARRIVKPGQVFSRIHIDDIANVLAASIARPDPGAVYNLCDDAPAPPEDVIAHAAELLGVPVPEAIPFEAAEMSPMARAFYAESKRVSNRRIRDELGVRLHHPDYRSGLAAMLAEER